LLNSPINKVDALGASPVSLDDLAGVGPEAGTAAALFLASSFVIPPPLPGSEESWAVSATMQTLAVGMCIDIDRQLGGKLLQNVGGAAMFSTLFVAGQAVGKIPESLRPGAFLDRPQSLAAAVVSGRLDALKYIGAGAHDLISGGRPGGDPDSPEQAGYDFARDLMNGDTQHGELDAVVLAGAIYDEMVSPLNYASLLFGLLSGDAAGAFSSLPDYAALNAWDMATDLQE
jgi:hypothetical protein